MPHTRPATPTEVLDTAADLAEGEQGIDTPADVNDYLRTAVIRACGRLDNEIYWSTRTALREHLAATGITLSTPEWSDTVAPDEMVSTLRAAADRGEGIKHDNPPHVARPFVVPAAA